jgi:hypothetical protein
VAVSLFDGHFFARAEPVLRQVVRCDAIQFRVRLASLLHRMLTAL